MNDPICVGFGARTVELRFLDSGSAILGTDGSRWFFADARDAWIRMVDVLREELCGPTAGSC